MTVEITKTIQVELSLELLAQCFANLDDDSQARFFVEVDKAAQEWERSACTQWYAIGSHLKNCECSTEGARNVIREIYNGLENGTH